MTLFFIIMTFLTLFVKIMTFTNLFIIIMTTKSVAMITIVLGSKFFQEKFKYWKGSCYSCHSHQLLIF